MKDPFLDVYNGAFEKNAQPGAAPAAPTAPAAPPPAAAAPGMPPPPVPSPESVEAPAMSEDQATQLTCDSACQFAQNPEKRCMLGSVTFTQDEQGTFMCSQFKPAMGPEGVPTL